MNPPPENPHEKLARALHETLRALPPRRAPRTLETRVFAELERRAALPWWRRSFAHWPRAARALFLLASAGLVKITLLAAGWAVAGFDAASLADTFATQFAWAQTGLSLARGVADFFGIVPRVTCSRSSTTASGRISRSLRTTCNQSPW